jgi:SSS family solute:Na+ symporter
MSAAIGIAVFVVAMTAGGTIWTARHGRRVDMAEWAVGDRSFGTVLLWFLSAGEIYTTFAFLGAAGWAYNYGAPGFYILANAPLGCALGYWLLPKMWRAGHDHGIMSQGDYIQARFGRRWLAVLISAIAILSLIPYIEIQLTGLSAITQVLFHGDITKTVSVTAAVIVLLLFVFTAGIRSSALASIIKDALVVAVLIAVAATIGAATGLGSIGAVFHRMDVAHPGYAALPGMVAAKKYSAWWFMSVLLVTNVGYWMWPHAFQANLTARSERTIRRNMMLQPLYTLSYFFIFVIGFAALLTLPHLKSSNQALVAVIAHSYPEWFVGLAAGAAVLVALVPSTVMLLTVGTTVARNIYRPAARLGDRHRLVAARLATLAAVLAAGLLALHSNATIVGLLLVAYTGISQIGPGVIASFVWRRVTAWGVAAGSVAGIALVGIPEVGAWWKTVSSINVGLPALAVNAVLVIGVSLLTHAPARHHVAVGLPAAPGDHDTLTPAVLGTDAAG